MIWNHPIETTITNWLFGVPGISYFIISKWVSKGKSLQKAIKIIIYINFVISDNVECVIIFVLFVAIGPSIAADLSPARENLSRKSTFRQDSKIPCCAAQTHLTFSVPELLCERRKAQSQACFDQPKIGRSHAPIAVTHECEGTPSDEKLLAISRKKTPRLPETTANFTGLKNGCLVQMNRFCCRLGLFWGSCFGWVERGN